MNNAKYEYRVERIGNDLQGYLNKMASDGWRCVSTMTNTGLGWTTTFVLEREVAKN